MDRMKKLNVHARPFIPGATGRNLCVATPTPEQIVAYKARKYGQEINEEDNNMDFAINIALDMDFEQRQSNKSNKSKDLITYLKEEILEFENNFSKPPIVQMDINEEYSNKSVNCFRIDV